MSERYTAPFHTVVDGQQQIWISVNDQSLMDYKYIIVPVQFTEPTYKRKFVFSKSTTPTKLVVKLL